MASQAAGKREAAMRSDPYRSQADVRFVLFGSPVQASTATRHIVSTSIKDYGFYLDAKLPLPHGPTRARSALQVAWVWVWRL